MDRPGLNLFHSKLARRTFALYVLSAVLPVLFIAALSYLQVSAQLRAQSYEQSRQSSKTIGMHLLNRLAVLDTQLRELSRRVDPGAPIVVHDSPASPDAAGFDAVTLLLHGQPARALFGELQPPTLTAVQKDHLAQGRTLLALIPDANGELHLLMVRHLEPESANALVFARLANTLYESLENLLPGSTRLHLIASNGEQALYPPKTARASPGGALRSALADAISGHFEWRTATETYLSGYWSVFTTSDYLLPSIAVVVSESRDKVLAPIAHFRTLYFPGLVGLILLISLVSANRIRHRMAPLVSLRDATSQVSKGNFSRRVEITSDDELAELGEAFNRMTGRLSTQFTSISTLAEIDRLILSSFDTRHIVNTVLCRAGDLTPCSVAAVIELDNSDHDTAMLSSRASEEDAVTHEQEVVISHAGLKRLLEDPDGLVLFETDALPECLASLGSEKATRFLLLPTFVKKQLAAVIVFGYDSAWTPERETQEQLRKFADHVAVALSNARWEERLYHQAHYDTLTNLPNRALLQDRLEQAIARAQRNYSGVGVLFIDLDRFKLVNDSLGHGAGDLLLKQIAEELLRGVRSVDTVVRFGGDEFIVIIPDIDMHDDVAAHLGGIAGKLLEGAGKEFALGRHKVRGGASIGIALYPKDGRTPDELIKHADTAMYHAKEQGRAGYKFFAPELNQAATRRLRLEQELRRALEQDEFQLYFQPKHDCLSGALTGAEALIRWQHPDDGMVAPDEFIALAEETGLILPIGEWVLKNVCAQLKTWREAGLPDCRVAVNLSPRQFAEVDVSATVARLLTEHELDPAALELEVTEGAIMDTTSDAVGKLKRLQQMGVRLSVDDFGTGYSSLNYLKVLPVNVLKIDRTFIVEMQNDQRASAIVSTIITLAHNLGLSVVAEGVETPQQNAQLQDWRCDECQGYLYSKPLPADQFEQYLRDSRRTRPVLAKALSRPV